MASFTMNSNRPTVFYNNAINIKFDLKELKFCLFMKDKKFIKNFNDF